MSATTNRAAIALTWISTEGNWPNVTERKRTVGCCVSQVVRRSGRPFHHGTGMTSSVSPELMMIGR